GEEVRAVVELDFLAPDQLQVGLVHQRGGVERLPHLTGELAPGHGVQFLVQAGEDLVERAAVAAAGGVQPEGDVSGVGHAFLYPCGQRPDYTATARAPWTGQRWQRAHQTVARCPIRPWRSGRPQ